MIRKKMRMVLAVLLIISLGSVVYAETPAPKDERKHTTLGKYATSIEAYEMWKANPTKVKIIDCRIPEEYAFIGHAPMAINVPSMLWTGKWSAEKRQLKKDDIQYITKRKDRIISLLDLITEREINKLADLREDYRGHPI